VWREYPVDCCYGTPWLCSTEIKVKGIVPKAAWHWGRDSSVVNDPLGEARRTQLYVGLLSAWGSVDSDHMFSPFFRGTPSFGESGRHKRVDTPMALETEYLSS
jgi:hypothetical protein